MLPFFKYQGTGNDFILVDQRQHGWLTREDTSRVAALCDRRFGIGADGLILLQLKEGFDFEMVYFNSDGRESTMCGNGGRCIVRFAADLGLIQGHTRFLAIDGPHEARLAEHGWVELQMTPVTQVESGPDYAVLNTGSPHYVVWVEDLKDIDVVENGKAIRYNSRFKQVGINVNFVQTSADLLEVATYERGVEDETWSCGTGVCAAAIASAEVCGRKGSVEYNIRTKGGDLQVRAIARGDGKYEDIWLCGPAVRVFQGEVRLPSAL